MLEAAIALGSLTALELVLGIDNIVFISVLVGRLPIQEQGQARKIGLALALLLRILLLSGLSWLSALTAPILQIGLLSLSGRDLILLAGGLFLLWKTASEIHQMLEAPPTAKRAEGSTGSFQGIILQIALIDLVFSLDSVITAIGMVDEIWIMVAAVVLSMSAMLVLSGPIAQFVEQHPSLKMLALSFLMLIGTLLLAEGLGHHLPKKYVYTAMAFSLFVEILNLRVGARSKSAPRTES